MGFFEFNNSFTEDSHRLRGFFKFENYRVVFKIRIHLTRIVHWNFVMRAESAIKQGISSISI
jgi:hypothetical protein